jgi:hypothetical protein
MACLPKASCSFLCVLGLGFGSLLLAEPPAPKKDDVKTAEPTKFIRVQRDDKDEPTALQTAVVRYVPKDGKGDLVVDLVAAVHIGDRDYYDQLNKQFEQYDVLLYELVAPEGTKISKKRKHKSDNPLSMIQDVMKSTLELESQIECVDYTKKNFVHADLSPEQMAEAMHKRGDDGMTVFLGVVADMLRKQNLQEEKRKDKPGKEEDLDIFSLLLDPNGALKLKRVLAVQFEEMDGGLGETLNTILISDRNEAAMKVFQKQLAAGKKKIGIFYGAGHMTDFDKRLREDFGLKRESEKWLTAWDLEEDK